MHAQGELELELAAVCDDYLLGSSAAGASHALDSLYHRHALLKHISEHHVLAIQPVGLDGAQEELRAVGVGTSVRHRQNARSSVAQAEVLILELVAVDGLAARSVSAREVASLAHEVGDHAVERGALEAEAWFSCAKLAEVLARLGHHICSKLHFYAAGRLAADGNVEVYDGIRHGYVEGLYGEWTGR